MKKNNHIQSVNHLLAYGKKEVCNVEISDVGSDKYFKIRLDFPNGSYRELFISWTALKGAFNEKKLSVK